jgi:hypothetical protein
MSVDLSHRIADYAHTLIAVHVKQEYENQIGEWEKYINVLIAHAKIALKNHERVLNKIKQQQLEEEQARAALFMIAFSLVSGPALSWVAGTIEHKVIPRYFRRKEGLNNFGRNQSPNQQFPKVLIYPPSRKNLISKVFGDFGGNLATHLLVNPVIKAATPNQDKFDSQLNMLGDSLSIDLFEANIKNLLVTGKQMGGTAIVNYAGTILKDQWFGDRWVSKIRTERPGLNERELEDEIKIHIETAVDLQRQEWANNKDWLYFGNNPPMRPQAILINSLEAEIWALWIILEEYRIFFPKVADTLFSESHHVRLEGKSGINLNKVLDRLVELGVFVGRTDAEKRKRLDQLAKAAASKATPRPKPTLSNLRKTIEQLQEEAGLLPAEVDGIKGLVDTREELAIIQEWASKRMDQSKLKNPIIGIPRFIGSLDPSRTP